MLRPRRPPAARAARAPLSHGGGATAEDRRSPSAAAGIARRSVRASLRELSRRSVSQRLGHMLLVDRVGVRQRRNRPGYARHPRPATARERQPLDRSVEKRGSSFCSFQRATGETEAGRSHASGDGAGRLSRRSAELRSTWPRQRDDEIEAVEQRSRELLPKGRQPLSRALAIRAGVAAPAAGTHVHAGDELETSRKDRPPSHSGHGDLAVLERLAQRLERRVAGIPEARRGRAHRDARAWPHPASGQSHPRRSPPPTRCDGVTETGACRSAAAPATGDRRRSGCV